MFASHRFPQRTLLDALVPIRFDETPAKHSQRTQQHNRLRFATASVFLVCYFSTGRVFPCSNDNFSPKHPTAHFLLLTSAHTSSHLFVLLQVSILVLLHRATTHNVVVFPSTAVVMRAPCTDPNETHTVPAHTGRSRSAPHESSCSETKCWSRCFWRWARSPICFGPVCSCDVHSTMTAALTMYPAARVLYSVYSGNAHNPRSSAHVV